MKLLALTLSSATLWGFPATAGAGGQATNRARAWYIIRHVFPASTRVKAFDVAECETGGFVDFYNEGSGAAGMFQEMPGNHGRVFYWNGRRLRLNWYKIKHYAPGWYSARVALFQSHGGTNWSEWSCG